MDNVRNWDAQDVEQRIVTLKIATETVAMIASSDKSAVAKNTIMRHRYQAEDLLNGKADDERAEYLTGLLTYILTLAEVFKGDLYSYAINYLNRAVDFQRKTPSDARTAVENGDMDFYDKSIGEEKDDAESDCEP